MQGWIDYFEEIKNRLMAEGRWREFVPIDSAPGPQVIIKGKKVILLCSNDYLGLTQSTILKKKAIEAIKKFGTGSGASRMISGSLELHLELEEQVARFKGKEKALVFSTGYMTNLGAVTSLVGKGDAIFSDELNHASLVDAARLSRAKIYVYKHLDMNHLKDLLKNSREQKKLIITDGVFSMDGDIVPLSDIIQLSNDSGALLLVDEAHATGVLGDKGKGVFEHFHIDPSDNVILMGTFSKALGGLGGFVAGKGIIIEHIKNHARSLFYTTALPPSVIASNMRALKLVSDMKKERKYLYELRKLIEESLKNIGLNVPEGITPIIPVIIGDLEPTVQFAMRLFEKGVWTPAIRPPTVPEGTCRLRISISSLHSIDLIKDALSIIEKVKEEE